MGGRANEFLAQPRLPQAADLHRKRATVIRAFIALANAIIITGRLIREAWTTRRWGKRPKRRPWPIGGISKT